MQRDDWLFASLALLAFLVIAITLVLVMPWSCIG
jgi:hypothetical protein